MDRHWEGADRTNPDTSALLWSLIMADAEDEGVKGSEAQQQLEEVHLSASPAYPEASQPAADRAGDAQELPAESVAPPSQHGTPSVEATLHQFKIRKFFVLRVK